MRKFTDISNKLYLILFTVCLLHSCGKDEVGSDGESVIKGNVPDPDGTISVSMRNGDNGNATFIDNCFYIGQDNNFSPRYYNCSFTCVGKVNGLGNITGIPEKGWSDKIAVEPGNGYVINYKGLVDEPVNKYYSLYVSDYITSTSGGIIGANVKYLTPFYGKDVEIKLDSEDKRFQVIDNEMYFIINNLNDGNIYFKDFNDIVAFECKIEGLVPNNIVFNYISSKVNGPTDGINISKYYFNEPCSGTVVITTAYGRVLKFKVTG